MSRYGDPCLADLLPACYCSNNNYNMFCNRRNGSSICKGILTHCLAMVVAIGLGAGAYYYFTIYVPNHKEHFEGEDILTPVQSKADIVEAGLEVIKSSCVESLSKDINDKIGQLKTELSSIQKWRDTVNAHLTKMQWEQNLQIRNAIDEALEIYEADGIALMDYAASYAGGTIIAISKETYPHPTHRPLSLFKMINFDVLSSPEEVIRPCVLPGSCFAFRGSSGSIKIKLGKPIKIGGITLSHASRYLLGSEGMSSAPKQFEVYGFTDFAEDAGTFLGKFKYNLMGQQHQTFPVKRNLSKNQIFEEVELNILSNYGKDEFTCVYRFRVHKSSAENADQSTQTNSDVSKKKMKKCC